MKSSLIYLSDINEFLYKKYQEYGNLTKYLDALQKKQKEVMPFLENVIMKYHQYTLSKERYEADMKSTMSYNTSYRGIMIFALVLSTIVLFLMLYRKIRKMGQNDKMVSSASEISLEQFAPYIKLIIVYGILSVMLYTFILWSIRSMDHANADIRGDLEKTPIAEEDFVQFKSYEGVALYHALRRNFAESTANESCSQNPRCREIKKIFDSFIISTPAEDGTMTRRRGKSAITYPTIEQVFQEKSQVYEPWKKVVSQVSDTLINKFQKVNSRNVLESSFAEIDRKVKLNDNVSLMKEIQNRAASLSVYVNNTPNVEMDISDRKSDIIKNEIVPAFKVISDMTMISGWDMKEGFSGGEEQTTVSSNVQCMLSCQIDDSCIVASFDGPRKKCTIHRSNIPEGTLMTANKDKTLYVKGTDNKQIFIQGAQKLKENPRATIFEQEGKEYQCKDDCLAGENCVKYIENAADGKCVKYMSQADTEIPVANIQTECNGSDCVNYKSSFKSIGKFVEFQNLFEQSQSSIAEKLTQIQKKYKYQINYILWHTEIKSELEAAYGKDYIRSFDDKIFDLLDKVQKKAESMQTELKSAKVPTYVSKEDFIENFNNMTLDEFMKNMLFTTDTLSFSVSTLNSFIQEDLSKNLSATDNIFLTQERYLKNFRFFITSFTVIIVLAYIYYVLNPLSSPIPSKNTGATSKIGMVANKAIDIIKDKSVDRYFKLIVPLVFVVLGVVMLNSWVKKTEALNDYNREILEKNGGNLSYVADSLFKIVTDIKNDIDTQGKGYSSSVKMSEINVSADKIGNLYDYIIETLRLLERCNLLLEGVDIELPFPWMDVSINLATIIICCIVAAVVFYQMNPVTLLYDIRNLNMQVKKVKAGETPDLSALGCDKMEDIGVMMKVIGFIVFMIIVSMFSMKLMRSAENYKMGLYNSKYYKESRCAT